MLFFIPLIALLSLIDSIYGVHSRKGYKPLPTEESDHGNQSPAETSTGQSPLAVIDPVFQKALEEAIRGYEYANEKHYMDHPTLLVMDHGVWLLSQAGYKLEDGRFAPECIAIPIGKGTNYVLAPNACAAKLKKNTGGATVMIGTKLAMTDHRLHVEYCPVEDVHMKYYYQNGNKARAKFAILEIQRTGVTEVSKDWQ